jgi:hypothetical protein
MVAGMLSRYFAYLFFLSVGRRWLPTYCDD